MECGVLSVDYGLKHQKKHFVRDFLQFCHFDTTAKPETPEETCWSLKASISYETSSNFGTWTHWKTKGIAAFPIDTAKPETPD